MVSIVSEYLVMQANLLTPLKQELTAERPLEEVHLLRLDVRLFYLTTLRIGELPYHFIIIGKGGRASISSAQKKSKNSKQVFADKCEWIRRSDRKRRKVYETLNVQMLTDHRFLTGFENSKPPKNSMERKRYFVEEESDSQTEGDEVRPLCLF